MVDIPNGSTTTTRSLPDHLKQFGNQNLTLAETIANRPYAVYGGERVAGLSPLERQARQNAVAGTERFAPSFDAANALMQRATSPLDLSKYQNPFTENVIDAVTNDIETATQRAQAESALQFSASGAFGGARHGVAQGQIYETMLDKLGEQSASLRAQSYTTALQAAQADRTADMVAARGYRDQGEALTGLTSQDVNMLNQLGADDRAIGQAVNDMHYADFQRQFNYPIDMLNLRTTVLNNTPYETVNREKRSNNVFGQILGAGLSWGLNSLF
jgi:hypothetical protein